MEETDTMIKTWKEMYPNEENYHIWLLSLSRRERMEWKKGFEKTSEDAKEENEIVKQCRERRRKSLLKFEALSHPPKLTSLNRTRTQYTITKDTNERKLKSGSFTLFLERQSRLKERVEKRQLEAMRVSRFFLAIKALYKRSSIT